MSNNTEPRPTPDSRPTSIKSQPISFKSKKIDERSRNNPHPAHVRHITGLDQVVCSTVEKCDASLNKVKTGKDSGSQHIPQTQFVQMLKGLNDIPVCTVLQNLEILTKSDKKLVKSMKNEKKAEGEQNDKPRILKFLDIWCPNRSQSLPDGLSVDEIGDFKLELVRRHNPHARRVCHIKGLNDVPVCVVRDQLNAEWENRFIVSPGSLAPTYSKPRRKYNSETFRSSHTDLLNPERMSRSSSRVSVPKMSLIPPDKYNNDLNEELDSIQALDILCSILQTNSLQTVQAWIEQATDEERNVVLRALREMKERGVLGKADQFPNNRNLPTLMENKASISYQNNWNQNKSLEEPKLDLPRDASPPPAPAPAAAETPKPLQPTPRPKSNTPVSTQTPVLYKSRPPTRIQMTGLSRPSTMKSVREKFMSGRSTPSDRAKDPGFSWTVKHRDSVVPSPAANTDVISKA